MDWREIDEKLIKRGELILNLDFLEHHQEELNTANKGKNGSPYKLAASIIQLLTAVRYLHDMLYRQLEGFTQPSTN